MSGTTVNSTYTHSQKHCVLQWMIVNKISILQTTQYFIKTHEYENLECNEVQSWKEEYATDFLLFQLEADKIEYVRFESCNINGQSFGKIVPVRHMRRMIEHGFAQFCGSWFTSVDYNFTGDSLVNGLTFRNRNCFPFYDTYSIVPWADGGNVARIMFYPTTKQGEVWPMDPRVICLKQLQLLKETGFELYSAFEHEFTMFDGNTRQPLWGGKEIFNHNKISLHEKFIYDCERKLYQMGIDLETMHLEYAPGQYEWTMRPAFGITSADNSFTYRNGIKQMAQQKNWMASFATTPLPNTNIGCSSGAHFNISLWKTVKHGSNDNSGNLVDSKTDEKELNPENERCNAFFDENDDRQLSEICYWFMGGILEHVRSLTVFCNSTQNCFRRTTRRSFCPGNATWGRNNRTVCIRVKPNGNQTYIEFRLPGAACCPYLVMASVVAAGMDGIQNKIHCGKECTSDAFDLEFQKAPLIPKDLKSALECLKADKVLVNAMGEEFLKFYENIKILECNNLEKLAEETSQEEAEIQIFLNL